VTVARLLVDDGARKPPADWLARLRELDPTVEVLWQGSTPEGAHRWELGRVRLDADRRRRAEVRIALEYATPLNPFDDEQKLRVQRDAKDRRLRFARWTLQGFVWQRELLQTVPDDRFFAGLLADWREGCWVERHPAAHDAAWRAVMDEASGEAHLRARQAQVVEKVHQDGRGDFRYQMRKARSFAFTKGAA